MGEFIFFMHDDAISDEKDWGKYLQELKLDGSFQGGSAMGEGLCIRKKREPNADTIQLSGYIRVTAKSLDHAKSMLIGNPVYEAGGTVEIRELLRTG